jgi:hypothetical protein
VYRRRNGCSWRNRIDGYVEYLLVVFIRHYKYLREEVYSVWGIFLKEIKSYKLSILSLKYKEILKKDI